MITGVIVTLNESKNIRDCIKSLQQVCSEIIVIDSESSDDTVKIAEELGARVINQPYLGDGIQKNIGLKYSCNDWILTLDADERLTTEAISEINNLDLSRVKYDAFAFRRKNHIGSRWIKRCGWYPDYCTRLYNKNTANFRNVKQHATVQATNIQRLNIDMIHYSFENIGQLFAKPERNFSSRAAKIMYKQGKRANAFSPVLHGSNAFIRKYIFQLGFLGGVDGMTVSLSSAINSYLKYAKLLEFQRDPQVLGKEDFDKIW